MVDAITFEHVTVASEDMRSLVGELDAELAPLYAPDQQHGFSIEKILQPHIRFFIARVGSEAAGCGAVAFFDGFAEAKRLYVREGFRGQGVADAILRQLEQETVAAGYNVLKLETGVASHAALGCLKRNGFLPCPAFAPYTAMSAHALAASVFLEKKLG